MVSFLLQLLTDQNRPADKIHTVPGKSLCFPLPQTAKQNKGIKRFKLVTFDGIEKHFRFCLIQGAQFLFLNSEQDTGAGWIDSDVAISYCLL